MSNMNEFKRFENDLRGSEELRKKLDGIFKRIAAEGHAGNDGEIMVAAAKELGYDISIAALEQARADAENLDPEELEAVAGGANLTPCEVSRDYACTNVDKIVDEYGHNQWCLAAWHCTVALRHTESRSRSVSCWSDWACLFINKPIQEGTEKI